MNTESKEARKNLAKLLEMAAKKSQEFNITEKDIQDEIRKTRNEKRIL